MSFIRWAYRWAVVLFVYVAALGYVACRVVKDRKFWRSFLRVRT